MIDYGFILKSHQGLTETHLEGIRSIGSTLFRRSYLESELSSERFSGSGYEVSLRLAVCHVTSSISLERRADAGDVLVGDLVALGYEVAKAWQATGVFWQMFYGGWRIRYCEGGKWQPENFESERDGVRFVPSFADNLAIVDSRKMLAAKLGKAFGCSVDLLLDLMKYTHEIEDANPTERMGNVGDSGESARDDPKGVFDLIGALGLHHPYNHTKECEFYQWRGLTGIVNAP